MSSKRTKHLAYIEDTAKHHEKLEKIAIAAAEQAIEYTLSKGSEVTFLEGNRIVKVDADGNKVVINTVELTQRRVKKGEKTNL